jgi:CRISPR-associated protein Cas2
MSDRHWYLVSYDIRDQKRWRRAYRQFLGRGERIQYSLFRCRLNRTEMEALRWELETLLEEEDDLMFVHLCPSCAGRIQERGEAKEWGGPSQQI